MQTLFTSDRMIVLGKITTHLVDNLMPAEGKEDAEYVEGDTVQSIDLMFIFQVNGKQTKFDYSFVIEKDEFDELSLSNWFEWYPVAELFFIMGYNFGEHLTHQSPMIMRKWMNECYGTKA